MIKTSTIVAAIGLVALSLAPRSGFAAATSSALGGTVCLTGSAWDSTRNQETPVTAIPYHLWANRGASSMRIRIPAREPDLKMNTGFERGRIETSGRNAP